MKIAILDDEISAVRLLTATLQELDDLPRDTEIVSFTNPVKGWEYLQSNAVNVVFLDIEMPVLSGLDIAEKLLDRYAIPPEIIFVTAYPQFALDAWSLDAADYVLKPYDTEQIRRALVRGWRYHLGKPANETSKPHIRCFPDFDVFLGKTPVPFSSKRAKELLALLVHHRGGWVTTEKLSFELLEDASESSSKNYIRLILSRLRQTLAKNGLSDILESQYGKVRVVPEKFDCDYYDYLAGEHSLFKGSYMGAYSWAQVETAYLCQKEGYPISD